MRRAEVAQANPHPPDGSSSTSSRQMLELMLTKSQTLDRRINSAAGLSCPFRLRSSTVAMQRCLFLVCAILSGASLSILLFLGVLCSPLSIFGLRNQFSRTSATACCLHFGRFPMAVLLRSFSGKLYSPIASILTYGFYSVAAAQCSNGRYGADCTCTSAIVSQYANELGGSCANATWTVRFI
jgi:hypothetical protein